LPEQSSTFAELYRKAGCHAELVLLPKAPHPFWNYMPWFEDTINRAAAFFHRVANQLSENQFSRSCGFDVAAIARPDDPEVMLPAGLSFELLPLVS
jgi:hypothetical protein